MHHHLLSKCNTESIKAPSPMVPVLVVFGVVSDDVGIASQLILQVGAQRFKTFPPQLPGGVACRVDLYCLGA